VLSRARPRPRASAAARGARPGREASCSRAADRGTRSRWAPAIGESAACLALGEEPPLPLARFDVERLLGAAGEAAHGAAARK